MNLRKARREASHLVHLTRPREFALAAAWLSAGPADRICDVACGDGYWTSRLAAAGTRVTGLDIDAAAIARAREDYGAAARFLVADAASLPLRDASFEGLISLCALQHFPNESHFLAEARRILTVGGKLCMSVDSLSLPWIAATFKAQQALHYQVRRLYDHASLGLLLQEEGFALDRYRYVGTSRFTSSLIQLQLSAGWEANYPGPVTVPLSRLADALQPSEDAGYSLVVQARRVG
jgi:SAM-dependent methyltransferase